MFIKQLSVFVENRRGRMEEVTAVLKEEQINIVSVSLTDTHEFGVLRLIVSEPGRAKDVLLTRGFSAALTEVMAVKLPNQVAALAHVLNVISDAGLDVEYMYVLDSSREHGSMVVKVSDKEKAVAAIQEGNIQVMTEAEAYMN